MSADETLRDSQSQAGSGRVARQATFNPVETLKDPFAVFGRDAGAFIFHSHNQAIPIISCSYPNRGLTPAVLGGILDQISQNRFNALGIGI